MLVQGVLIATLPLRVAVALILAGCHTCPFSTIVLITYGAHFRLRIMKCSQLVFK